MKVTQGQFSFLPDLTDEEIKLQVQYGLDQGWAMSIEYTYDPHPRNAYWEMFGLPMFDLKDAAGIMMELESCRSEHKNSYIKILAFDNRKGWESVRMSFMVNRPDFEPGFELVRQEMEGRHIRYTLRSYSMATAPTAPAE